MPELIERENRYYLSYMDREIEIEAAEAEYIKSNPDGAFDVIIAHTRKFDFNATGDNVDRFASF